MADCYQVYMQQVRQKPLWKFK